jgi:hypothetical protein
MSQCSRCGQEVSPWTRDLFTGACPLCHQPPASPAVTLLRKRWRWWLGLAAGAWVTFSLWMLLPYVGLAPGISEANVRRIAVGMTQEEVEAILGPPNPLPDLQRAKEALWDTKTTFGYHYLAIHVEYDADGRVARTGVNDSWSKPW